MVFVEPTSVFKEREGRKMEIVKQRKTKREKERGKGGKRSTWRKKLYWK